MCKGTGNFTEAFIPELHVLSAWGTVCGAHLSTVTQVVLLLQLNQSLGSPGTPKTTGMSNEKPPRGSEEGIFNDQLTVILEVSMKLRLKWFNAAWASSSDL